MTLFHNRSASFHDSVDYDEDHCMFTFKNPMLNPLDDSGGVQGPSGARFVVHGIASGRGLNPPGAFALHGHDSGKIITLTGLPNYNLSHPSPANSSGSAAENPVPLGPVLSTVVEFAGASNILFHNISFRHARGDCPDYSTCDGEGNPWLRDSVIHISNQSSNLMFTNIQIVQSAGWGMTVQSGDNITIENSTFQDLGGGAIRIGSAIAASSTASNIALQNIIVETVGANYPGAVGIHIAGSCSGVRINRTTIRNVTGSGILIGMTDDQSEFAASAPTNVAIENSLLEHIGLYVMNDIGGIKVVESTNTTISNCIVRDVMSFDHHGNGITIKGGNVDIESILVHDTKSASVAICSEGKVSITNAIFTRGAVSPINDQRAQSDGGLDWCHNDHVDTGHLAVSKVLVSLSSGFLFNGTWPLANMTANFSMNLYFAEGSNGNTHLVYPNGMSKNEWTSSGQDTDSLFDVNPELSSDFNIPTTSPAVSKLGFKSFNYSSIGYRT